jgi:aminoglycoside phosphotransferase (APT) family kinase protein
MIVAVNKDEITADVAVRLVAAQFPQWAGLPVVPVALDGYDNTTFRLGDELSIRLPSSDSSVAQVAKEHRWLPVLARHLPLPIPAPVAVGRPGDGFPRPWSVYRCSPPVRMAVQPAPDYRHPHRRPRPIGRALTPACGPVLGAAFEWRECYRWKLVSSAMA